VSELVVGSDLALSRGFRGRRRGDLERASAELLAAQRLDPMNLFVYGELMQLAALRRIHLDAPFAPEALRAEARLRIDRLEAALASESASSGCRDGAGPPARRSARDPRG
jgi:protein involved in temperature-dependent protein secretion